MQPYEIPDINSIIPQGSDRYEFWQIFNAPGESHPFNLTDYTARCDLRTHFNSGKPIATLTSENGGIILGAEETAGGSVIAGSLLNGGLALVYPHLLTTGIKFTGDSITLLRQVELTDKNGVVERIINGTITITRESTKQ